MKVRQLIDPATSTHTYLVFDPESRAATLIDPVLECVERDLALIDELGLDLVYIAETHVHADHVTAAGVIRERTGARTVVSARAQVACADIGVDHGDRLGFGNLEIRVIATPGHTAGCVSYLIGDAVFTGDALLVRGCGRTDFQEGHPETLYRSITERLFELPDETTVYPGHDYKGRTSSTIGEEKRFNPRLTGKTSDEFCEIMNGLNLAPPARIAVAVPANRACGSANLPNTVPHELKRVAGWP